MLEEGEGSGCDFEGTLSIPDNEGVVELLGYGNSGKVPRLDEEGVNQRGSYS